MQNSQSAILRGVSKSNLPAAIVTCTIEAGKVFSRYLSGEISSEECLRTLGETGTGMVSSAMFATVGQMAIPIPLVGAAIGSMIGYALSSASYGALVSSLQDARIARERRIQIEKECKEQIKLLQQYRAEMEKYIETYLSDLRSSFTDALTTIKRACLTVDCDGFVEGCNKITEKLGQKVQFRNRQEFDNFMNSDEAFDL